MSFSNLRRLSVVKQEVILASNEEVARCVIHPRYLHPSGGPFDPKYLLDLKRAGASFVYKSSVAWRKYLPLAGDVHGYGCNSAAQSNENRVANGKPCIPMESAAHYIGFYNIGVGEAQSASNEIYSVYVEHWPENDSDAHCHLVLAERENLNEEQTKLKGHYRTNVISALWASLNGPERHVCACDSEHSKALNNLELPLKSRQPANDHGSVEPAEKSADLAFE